LNHQPWNPHRWAPGPAPQTCRPWALHPIPLHRWCQVCGAGRRKARRRGEASPGPRDWPRQGAHPRRRRGRSDHLSPTTWPWTPRPILCILNPGPWTLNPKAQSSNS